MLPKAYTYIVYFESEGKKSQVGSVEATNPRQAKQRIIKSWRNVISDLEKKIEEGELNVLVYRSTETNNYYKGGDNNGFRH